MPHVTGSYNCTNDTLDQDFPYCVIKSFPNCPDHAITWALAKVQNLSEKKPIAFNEFWAETNKDDLCQRLENGNLF